MLSGTLTLAAMASNDARTLPNPQEVCHQLLGFLKDRLTCLQTVITDHRQSISRAPVTISRSDRPDHVERLPPFADPSYQRTNLTVDQRSALSGQHFTSPVTKEDLGRATWLLLHTVAAQYPARPSKQQRKDVAALVRLTCLQDPKPATRGGDVSVRTHGAGRHIDEDLSMWRVRESLSRYCQVRRPQNMNYRAISIILEYDSTNRWMRCVEWYRSKAPATSSAEELQQWACEVHNLVNASLGKASFNCKLVQARWNGLDCGTDMACDMTSRGTHARPFS